MVIGDYLIAICTRNQPPLALYCTVYRKIKHTLAQTVPALCNASHSELHSEVSGMSGTLYYFTNLY